MSDTLKTMTLVGAFIILLLSSYVNQTYAFGIYMDDPFLSDKTADAMRQQLQRDCQQIKHEEQAEATAIFSAEEFIDLDVDNVTFYLLGAYVDDAEYRWGAK